MEEFVTITGLCYSHIGNLYLTLFLTFEHLLSQAIYSLGKHFEYLISYILKINGKHGISTTKSKLSHLLLPVAFSPKHRLPPLQLSEIRTHFHSEIRLIPCQYYRGQKEKQTLWSPRFRLSSLQMLWCVVQWCPNTQT